MSRLTVIVVTWRRPDSLRRCLLSLADEAEVGEVVVVDASPTADDLSEVGPVPLRYVHAPDLAGRMTDARNRGLLLATSLRVAFIDDDVTVHSGWARALLNAFDDHAAVAVSGRALDVGHPASSARPVGQVLEDGRLTGNFSADLSTPTLVRHGLGANMAFDRALLCELGGFRAIFPGTALREDTDVFLRIGRHGNVIFEPAAVVDHHGAAHVVGQRFDRRYMYWARHNHVLMLLGHPELRRRLPKWTLTELLETWRLPSPAPRRLVRLVLALAAMAHGFCTAGRLSRAGELGEAGSLIARTRPRGAGRLRR